MPYLVEVLKTLSQDSVKQRFMEQNTIIYVSSQNRFQQRFAVLKELVKVLMIFSQFRVPRWCSEVEDLVQVLKALTHDRVPLRPLAVCHLRGPCFASRSWRSSWWQCLCQTRSFWRGAGPHLVMYGTSAWGQRRSGSISYVELLILYELWAGERLVLEKAHPRYLRPGRPISVSVVPFGPGIDIWRSCRFIGAVMRSLCMLPGGLGRFVPCSIGANHCRLRHLGWERCCHGLTSRPQESASDPFLDQLLLLFHCPPRSSGALLAGFLPLRYCSA